MYFVYDKDGKAHKVGHPVDVIEAVKSGNYTKLPPGVKEPEPAKKEPEGEKFDGIVLPEDDLQHDAKDMPGEEQPAADIQKAKGKGVKIPRK
jgi:hypothetical protein